MNQFERNIVLAGLAGAGCWMVGRALSPKERSALGSAVVEGCVSAVEENLLDRWIDLADRSLDDAVNPKFSDDDEFMLRCLDRAHSALDEACSRLDRSKT